MSVFRKIQPNVTFKAPRCRSLIYLIALYLIFIHLSGKACSTEQKTIYIHPGQWVDLFSDQFNQDNSREPMQKWLNEASKAGYTLKQTQSLQGLQNFDYLIVFEIPTTQLAYLKEYPKEKLILFLWEPPSVAKDNYEATHHQYFSKVYTWADNLVDNQKYFKFYYPVLHKMIDNPMNFNQKKFASMIACNKHSNHPHELYSKRRGTNPIF